MATSLSVGDDSLILELWKAVLEWRQVSVSWNDFERLILWARERGFFSVPGKVFSREEWSLVGACLMEALFDDCTQDVGSLLIQWKRCEELWRDSSSCSSRSSQGSPSVSDVEEGEGELLCDIESPSTLQDGVSCAGDGLASLYAFPALEGQLPPRIESDSVTTLCPHCGVSTTFPLSAEGVGSHSPGSGSSVGEAALSVSGSAQPAGQAQSVKAAGGGSSVGAPSIPAPVGGQPAPLRSVGAVPTVESCGLGRALIGGLPGSLVPPRSDAAPRAAPLSASRPTPASGVGGPTQVPSRPVPDLRAVPAPASTEASPAGAAARQGAGVFTFSATADTASGRPVAARGHGASSSNLWTLPACQVTVRPKYPERFWREDS
ncbi:transcription initiation factor TFIID subunit 10 [Geothlypis trichas]